MRHTCRNWTLLLAGALAALAAAPPTAADVISLDFTGLNLKFDAGNIYDAAHLAGGNGLIAEATALGSITFYKNYEYVESLSGDVYADILVEEVLGIPEDGWVETAGGSYVDLLSPSGWLLGLDIGPMIVSYTNFGGMEYVGINGFASGITTQDLPGGLIIAPGSEITILLRGTLSDPAFDGGELLVGFGGLRSGMGEIVAIPEPGSLMILLSLAASALAACAWRVASMKARCL